MLGGDEAPLDALGADRLGVEAVAVILDSDDHELTFVLGAQTDGPAGRLAPRQAELLALDAMVHRVADQVQQRIDEVIEDALVELGLGALGDQVHLLTQRGRQIVHQAVEAAEGGADRHHLHAEHAVPELHDQPLERLHAAGQRRVGGVRGELR